MPRQQDAPARLTPRQQDAPARLTPRQQDAPARLIPRQQAPRRYSERVIRGAATLIKRYLRKRHGGRMPRSEAQWLDLIVNCGSVALPLDHCPFRFGGEVRVNPDTEMWFIVYNARLPLQERCRVLCHELFELMSHHEFASVFDGTDFGRRHASHPLPEQIRHEIALRGEHLCFRSARQNSWNIRR